MKNPQVIFLIVIVAVALIFGGYLLAPSGSSTPAKASATPASQQVNADPTLINNSDSVRIGKSDAKEQVVVFSDFLCPYCQQAHKALADTLSTYPDDVSVVYRNFIVHPTSKVLAEAALAANIQGKYNQMADQLFSDDSFSKVDVSNDDGVIALAQKIGLDVNKFKSDLHSSKVDGQIDKDNADAQSMNIGGTPSIFLNNTSVDNFNNLASLVKSQLGK